MTNLALLAEYSKQDDFKVLGDDILKLRREDDFMDYIIDVCKEADELYGSIATFDKAVIDEDFSYMDNLQQHRAKNGKVKKMSEIVVDPRRTDAKLVKLTWKLKYKPSYGDSKMERRTYVQSIYVPILDRVTGEALIRGNKYSIPIQLIDATAYAAKYDHIVLKGSFKLKRESKSFSDIYGKQYNSHVFLLNMPVMKNKRVPFLLFYFGYFGFEETLRDYFGIHINVYDGVPPATPPEDEILFKLGNLTLGVNKEQFETGYHVKQIIATTLSLSKKTINNMSFRNVSFWRIYLGMKLYQKDYELKAKNLINILLTSVNSTNRRIINDMEGDGMGNSIWSIIRWMFIDFNTISTRNGSLYDKRMRICEYVVSGFAKRMIKDGVYRFIQMSNKEKDIDRLVDMFKVSPEIIINSIIGKSKDAAITKYSAPVNDMTLANGLLSYTFTGPGTFAEGGSARVSDSFRDFHYSYVGNLCLLTISNNNVGLTGDIAGNAVIDHKTKTFVPIEQQYRNRFRVS